jgi:hypothetical protein
MGNLRQCGVIPIGLIIWGLAGLAVIAAVGGGIHSYNSAIRRADKAEASLADCTAKYHQALKTIEKQSQAVRDAKAAEKNALDRARIARQAATKAKASTQVERGRLAALQQGSAGLSCQQAVAKAKEGLRP